MGMEMTIQEAIRDVGRKPTAVILVVDGQEKRVVGVELDAQEVPAFAFRLGARWGREGATYLPSIKVIDDLVYFPNEEWS